MSVKVAVEVWRHEDDPKIHLKLLEGAHTNEQLTVDARANYSGGNPRLYKALDAILRDRA